MGLFRDMSDDEVINLARLLKARLKAEVEITDFLIKAKTGGDGCFVSDEDINSMHLAVTYLVGTDSLLTEAICDEALNRGIIDGGKLS